VQVPWRDGVPHSADDSDKEQIVLMPSAAVRFAAEPERGLREDQGIQVMGLRQARYVGLLSPAPAPIDLPRRLM